MGQPQDRRSRPGLPSFTSGGATLDHEDPRIVYLSRRTGAFHQVEAWFTPDNGNLAVTAAHRGDPDHYCIRPVTPRGLTGANLVLFSRGDRSTKGFTDFRTRIHAAPRPGRPPRPGRARARARGRACTCSGSRSRSGGCERSTNAASRIAAPMSPAATRNASW